MCMGGDIAPSSNHNIVVRALRRPPQCLVVIGWASVRCRKRIESKQIINRGMLHLSARPKLSASVVAAATVMCGRGKGEGAGRTRLPTRDCDAMRMGAASTGSRATLQSQRARYAAAGGSSPYTDYPQSAQKMHELQCSTATPLQVCFFFARAFVLLHCCNSCKLCMYTAQ